MRSSWSVHDSVVRRTQSSTPPRHWYVTSAVIIILIIISSSSFCHGASKSKELPVCQRLTRRAFRQRIPWPSGQGPFVIPISLPQDHCIRRGRVLDVATSVSVPLTHRAAMQPDGAERGRQTNRKTKSSAITQRTVGVRG